MVFAARWLGLWVAGLFAGLIVVNVFFLSLEAMGLFLAWPLQIFLAGFWTAGVAALISGRALFAALSSSRSDEGAATPSTASGDRDATNP